MVELLGPLNEPAALPPSEYLAFGGVGDCYRAVVAHLMDVTLLANGNRVTVGVWGSGHVTPHQADW